MMANWADRPWPGALVALLACTAAPAAAQDEARLTAFSAPPQWRVLSAQRLSEIRGGFEMPDLQLRLSFGLEQSVLVNGELVARTVLNIERLRQSVGDRVSAVRNTVLDSTAGLNAQIQAQVAAQLQAVGLRTTTINTVSTPQAQTAVANAAAQAVAMPAAASPAAPASPPAAAASSPAPVASGASGAAAGSTGSGTVGSVQVVTPALAVQATAPVTVVQSGPGNVVSGASVVGNDAMNTIIQNTLDDQRIQVLTEVSASANSLQVLRAMNMAATIREGVINSLRR
ncbi:hypothetical protein [Denitromonas iodatirespirans]|uniref:Flagellin n=1 Tax=Denitromonas iodatirespirans TaxID=2795389 RepID=A0A944H9J3_DENI1|nr:hypothetical protein [Denitromonas iodatirespirans]MBT0963488.1 hypothetical protein [Denitromonas iodatirespirans]